MADLEIRGGHPQSCEPAAGEVVLTRAESHFLSLTLAALSGDPFDTPSEEAVAEARDAAGLSPKQAAFVESWISHQGDLVALSEESFIEPSSFVRYLTAPVVFRVLTEAARRWPNLPSPIPTKEELAAAWGIISRLPSMPLNYQKEARQELAKLMGYYPNGSDAVNVGVQVIVKGDLTND